MELVFGTSTGTEKHLVAISACVEISWTSKVAKTLRIDAISRSVRGVLKKKVAKTVAHVPCILDQDHFCAHFGGLGSTLQLPYSFRRPGLGALRRSVLTPADTLPEGLSVVSVSAIFQRLGSSLEQSQASTDETIYAHNNREL